MGLILTAFSFFFSSRRRHTRSKRDWSSDVCSSDLPDRAHVVALEGRAELGNVLGREAGEGHRQVEAQGHVAVAGVAEARSEERRVGKECRCWWWAEH